MRYIGLDLGTKTLGVSISDRLGLIASTYKTIRYDNEDYPYLIDELKKIIESEDVKGIVLGLPKNMNNSLGDSANRSLLFKELLEENFDLDVFLQDERMSTVEAHNIMLEGDLSRKKRKKKVDSLAANIILQRFLDSKGN